MNNSIFKEPVEPVSRYSSGLTTLVPKADVEDIESKSYSNLLQGKSMNALTSTNKSKATENRLTGMGHIMTSDNVEVFLKSYNNIKLNAQTHKVLDALTLQLTTALSYGEGITAEEINRQRKISMSVDEYMSLCELKDKKEARKQLKEATQALYEISLEWDETRYIMPDGKKRKRKETVHFKTRICDAIATFNRGRIAFSFSFDIAEYLSNAYIMPYPNRLFTVNSRYNPNSYYIGKKLANHYNMNISKKNANIISVESLLQCTPELPRYENIASGGEITRRIIEPFERDLNALVACGVLQSWEYCNSNGKPLEGDQLNGFSYDIFSHLLISFKLTNYPYQGERIKKLENYIKKSHKKKVEQ